MKFLQMIMIFFFFTNHLLGHEYEKEIIYYTDVDRSLNTYPLSYISNSTPQINNEREVAINLRTIDGRPYSGVWLRGRWGTEIIYTQTGDELVGDLSLSEDGRISFLEFLETGSLDGYELYWNGNSYIRRTTIALSGKEDFIGFSHLQSKVKGTYFFRAYTQERNHGLYLLRGNEITSILKTPEVSYLFTPATNKVGGIAYKVRAGIDGDFSESAPDRIEFYQNGITTLIAEDRDSNESSRFLSLRNLVAVNDLGEVVFMGVTKTGTGLWKFAQGALIEMISPAHPLVKEIDYFAPVINNSGLVVFRGKNQKNQSTIWAITQNDVHAVLNTHEVFLVEGESIQTFYGETNPTFGGGIGLNDHGDIVVNSSFSDAETGRFDRGQGIIALWVR